MKIIFILTLAVAVIMGLAASGFIKIHLPKGKSWVAAWLCVSLAAIAACFFAPKTYRMVLLFLVDCIICFEMLIILNFQIRKAVSRIILAIMLIEAVLFNIPAFYTWFGDYKQESFAVSELAVETNGDIEYTEDGGLNVEGDQNVCFYLQDLNKPVASITVEIEFGSKAFTVDMTGSVSDDTHQTYRNGVINHTIYRYETGSQTALCTFYGNAHDIKLQFEGEQKKGSYVIKSISINQQIEFSVSVVRVLILFVLCMLVYCTAAVNDGETLVRQCPGRFTGICWAAFVVFASLVILMVASKINPDDGVFSIFFKESGDQVTQELVDAFEAGSLSLLTQPSDELKAMENPYDRGLREEENVGFLWDHLYYNGKYYSYYGIAPVLLLYLPFHLITGYYFPCNIAVVIFSVVGLAFLTKTYKLIIKKWFSDISVSVALFGLLILLSACGIYYSAARPKFYEGATSCSFMFVAAGAYFLLASNVVGEGKISLPYVTMSSLMLAFAVLSRPTAALYCICACLFYAAGFKKKRQAGCGRKKTAVYIFAAVFPMAVFGAIQMAYNYLRFGSPFEFGIQYSLTINDFTRVTFHIIYVMILFYNYLAAPVKLQASYPVISADFSKLSLNGYMFKDQGNAPGLLFMALPVAGYILAGKALKKLPKKNRLWPALLIGMTCVVVPMIMIAAAWNSGYSLRYFSDFSWEIIIGALMILFFLYVKCKNATVRRFFKYFMCFSAVWAMVVISVNVYNACYPSSQYPYMAYELEQFFCFWL